MVNDMPCHAMVHLDFYQLDFKKCSKDIFWLVFFPFQGAWRGCPLVHLYGECTNNEGNDIKQQQRTSVIDIISFKYAKIESFSSS